MLQSSETEREILLGNTQLLGIFFVVAVLLGGAFTGGYMLGRGSGAKKPVAAVTPASTSSGATMSVPAEPAPGGQASTSDTTAVPTNTNDQTASDTAEGQSARTNEQDGANAPPLGSPKRKGFEKAPAGGAAANFVPQTGQTFLQVAAVGRNEAEAIADVLHRKGFRAHAVAIPGNSNLYRVLIGPLRDASEFSSARDSLRKTGFNDVIARRY